LSFNLEAPIIVWPRILDFQAIGVSIVAALAIFSFVVELESKLLDAAFTALSRLKGVDFIAHG
jgi:hypothetical protein